MGRLLLKDSIAESRPDNQANGRYIPFGLLHFSTNLEILAVDEVYCAITGWSAAQLTGNMLSEFLLTEHIADKERFISLLLDETSSSGFESEHRCGNGATVWLRIYSSIEYQQDGSVAGFRCTVEDITPLKALESVRQHLDVKLHRDALTGLLNRTALLDYLSGLTVTAGIENEAFSLTILNIDHFRQINNSTDHEMGDMLLQQLANRIAGCVTAPDIVARIGGDEFVILLHGVESQEKTAAFCQKIMATVATPFELAGQQLCVTCSMGTAFYPHDADNAVILYKAANLALSQAREVGRNNSQFFSRGMFAAVASDRGLETALRQAIAQDLLRLQYQPQIDLQTGKICALEARIDWNGLLPAQATPQNLMQFAERLGLLAEVYDRAIRRICVDMRIWLHEEAEACCVIFHVSSRQFLDALMASRLIQILEQHNIPPQRLCLGIPESVFMQDAIAASANLQRLKEQGLGLILEGAGTGFASFNSLKRFSFDKVNLDQSLINAIARNTEDAAMLKALISVAHGLGIKVVAQGVESEAQCLFLSQNMCDEVQAYFFSEAVDAEKVRDMLQQETCLPAHLLHFHRPQQTLLIVDDENNIIGALKRLLRGGNFNILTANSGQAGLDILAQHNVDVIISDQRMPIMTGVEFLRMAKQLYPDTVRIVLSGYTELHSVTDAVNEGAIYKFLTKPWDDAQLKGHIEEAFKSKAMANENQRLNLEVRTANQKLANANRQLEELVHQKQQQIILDEVSLDIVREAMQRIPLALIGVDNDNAIVFANDAAQQVFGHRILELGNDLIQLIPELLAVPMTGNGAPYILELDGVVYELIAKTMGRGSKSQGKVITLTQHRGRIG